MANTSKISITVPTEELAWAKKLARKRKASLSLVVSEALTARRKEEARQRLLEWLEKDGDISEKDRAAARRELWG